MARPYANELRRKFLQAYEQGKGTRGQGGRESIRKIAAHQLVFLDARRAGTQMTRKYRRAPGGERVAEGTPQSHWHTVTMLAALTTQGLQAPMTIESPTDV